VINQPALSKKYPPKPYEGRAAGWFDGAAQERVILVEW